MAEDEKIELDEESIIEDSDQDDDLNIDELELNSDQNDDLNILNSDQDDDLNIDELELNIEDESLDASEDEQMDLLDLEEDFSLDDEVADDTTSKYNNIELLLDISLDLIVELGGLKRRIGDVLKLKQGSVLELDRAAGEPVDVYINERLIARGEVVVHEDDNLGIKIINILNPADRLRSLRSSTTN